ncbi:unnamed protein product [Cochlearia groenlandica]
MADESHYSSDSYSNKRKYDDQSAPPRRPTGFSSGPISSSDPISASAAVGNPPPSSYNSVPPPPMDEIQIAKQKAQEIAARLLNSAEAKRPRVDNGSSYDYGSYPSESKQMSGMAPSSIPVSYGSFQGGGTTKKIDIPNMRVGVIIGKGGETIKYLQLQSGAKIQVTRDMDADPSAQTRTVDLTGTSDQISKAEELINEVLQEAEAGGTVGSGGGSRRMGGQQAGSDQFVMKIPNNKVGLVIGKGGETIKSMQAQTGARIQVIPLHLPPGDPTPERTLQIDGTTDQIEHAKQLVNEIISGENRMRSSSMGGGYQQQGYQARPPSSWAPPGAPSAQQPGYGYMQQGAYPGPPQYGQSPYGSYPQQGSAGYGSTWDQSSAPPSQQSAQGEYDYYGQQQQPSSGGSSAPPTDTTGYNYYQQGYGQAGQGYGQDGYGGYNASQQAGYGQAGGYDQQQGGYGSNNNPNQEEDTSQTAPPSSAQPATQGSTGQAGYGAASQAGYSSQPPTAYSSGYGAPPPGAKPPTYCQSQQSPGAPGSYGSQTGYAQPAASGYGPPPAYGYGQAQQGYGSYGGYPSDGSAGAAAGGGAPAPQSAPPAAAPKASPKS